MTRRYASLGQAAAIVGAGVLLSRILGVVREQVISGLLGRSAETDLYVYAFAIPDYLYFLLAGGYLSITLVPILTSAHVEGSDTELNRTFTAVFRVVAMVAVVILIGGLVFARPLVELLPFENIDADGFERLIPMTRIAIGLQVFFLLGGLFTAAQYAEKRFTIPAMGPLVYNIGIIAGGLVGAVAGDPSPESFLIGGLVGAALGSFGLQWYGAHRLGIRLVTDAPFRHPAVGRYFVMALPLMLGQSVVALDEQWPRWFGAMLSEGTAAGLNFARRLNMVPVGVIAQAAAVASFPFMARLFSENRKAEMRATVNSSLRTSLAIGALATGLVIPNVEPIVRIIFQYGRFTQADTETVATFLLFFSISIPFWVIHQVVTRAFYAQRRLWLPVLMGTATTLITVPVLFYLTDRNGGNGVAAGSTFGVALYATAITVMWLREGTSGELSSFARFAVKVVAAASVAGFVSLIVLTVLRGPAGQIIAGLLGGVLGGGVYLGLARVLGVEEVSKVMTRIRSGLTR